MTDQDNLTTVRDIYAAFSRGDIPAILKELGPDTALSHSGLPGSLPWGGVTYTGPDEWERFFEELGTAFEAESFEPEHYLAGDDLVMAIGLYQFRGRATGKIAASPWAMAWRFRDGRPISCRVYEDTETMADALGPR